MISLSCLASLGILKVRQPVPSQNQPNSCNRTCCSHSKQRVTIVSFHKFQSDVFKSWSIFQKIRLTSQNYQNYPFNSVKPFIVEKVDALNCFVFLYLLTYSNIQIQEKTHKPVSVRLCLYRANPCLVFMNEIFPDYNFSYDTKI